MQRNVVRSVRKFVSTTQSVLAEQPPFGPRQFLPSAWVQSEMGFSTERNEHVLPSPHESPALHVGMQPQPPSV